MEIRGAEVLPPLSDLGRNVQHLDRWQEMFFAVMFGKRCLIVNPIALKVKLDQSTCEYVNYIAAR